MPPKDGPHPKRSLQQAWQEELEKRDALERRWERLRQALRGARNPRSILRAFELIDDRKERTHRERVALARWWWAACQGKPVYRSRASQRIAQRAVVTVLPLGSEPSADSPDDLIPIRCPKGKKPSLDDVFEALRSDLGPTPGAFHAQLRKARESVREERRRCRTRGEPDDHLPPDRLPIPDLHKQPR